jgi:DUF1680 family protein
LYSYLDNSDERPRLEVNGEAVAVEPVKGYAVIERAWQPGDTVTLDLPMPVRRVIANEKVEADRGRVALMRGPIVYCVEGTDVEGGKARELILDDKVPLATEFRGDLLGGVQVISGIAGKTPFTAVPYCTWANRTKGEMAVWLARTPDSVAKTDNE